MRVRSSLSAADTRASVSCIWPFPASRWAETASGETRKRDNSSRYTASKSSIGILLRHFAQMYFGEFEATYIFPPQSQKAKPEKRWTFSREGFLCVTRRSARTRFTSSHSSSFTMGGTGVKTHSLSGLYSHCFVRSFEVV